MIKTIRYCLCLGLLIPTLSSAHGPSRVLLTEEITINAEPANIWAVISDYCAIQTWHPAVTACHSDKGDEIGSIRTITLDNGEQIREILAKHDPENFKLQHYMDHGQKLKAFPITTHGLTMTITGNGQDGGSVLKWKGSFYRSFQGPTPPPELSDEFAAKKLTEFYRAGLENIKKISE